MKMNVNDSKIESMTIEYLNEKYHQNFSVLNMAGKIDPELGTYVLITCTDDVYNEKFYTYYSLGSSTVSFESEDDDEIDIGDVINNFEDNGTFRDEYGAVVFGHKYAAKLSETLPDNSYVICQMALTDYYPMKHDIDSSLDSGNGEWKNAAHPKIFIFYSTDSIDVPSIQELILSNELSMQYVYICKVDNVNKTELDTMYRDSFETFEDDVVESSKVSRIDFFYTTAEDGLRSEQVIKE